MKTDSTAMKKRKKKPLVPRLRFPEFRGNAGWEHGKLSAHANPVKEKAAKVKSNEVLTLSGEHGLVRQTDYFVKKIAGDNLNSYLRIERDDFVYNDRTTKSAKYGSLKRLTAYSLGAVSPIYKCFRLHGDENPFFWEYYFGAGAHEDGLGEFINEGARAGRFNISVDTFLSITVVYPSPEEQQKIADCLSSLDSLITAHSFKLAALQTHKKGLLQQLFPAEGQTTPVLRFPEFENAGSWNQKKAGKLFENRRERGVGGLEIYSVTVNDGMVKRSSLHRDFGDIETPAGNKRVYQGDIAYNMMRMWQGASGEAEKDCMVSPAYIVLSPKAQVWTGFFGYLLKIPHYKLLLTAYSRGLTKDRLRLYYDDFASIPLCFPGYPEQKKIAACLSSLDSLITAQTKKITVLKTHKKGLMQQLFPNPEPSKA